MEDKKDSSKVKSVLLSGIIGFGVGSFLALYSLTAYIVKRYEPALIDEMRRMFGESQISQEIKYDLNGDEIKDKTLFSEAGLYQIQYGVINNQTSELEYLTREEIVKNAKKKIELDNLGSKKPKESLERETSILIKRLEEKYP